MPLLILGPLAGCDPSDPTPLTEVPDSESFIRWESGIIDECGGACGSLLVADEINSIESNLDGFLNWINTEDGRICITSRLRPGLHTIAIQSTVGTTRFTELTSKPFGWKYDLDRLPTSFDEPEWIPDHEGLELEPVFSPAQESWDALSVMMPSTIAFNNEEHLFYAGTADEDFLIGQATRSNSTEPWTRTSTNPIVPTAEVADSAWRQYAQNTPEALVIDGEIWLYYTGRSEVAGGLAIGLAQSSDGRNFIDNPNNPILAPSGSPGTFDEDAVAHPSVLKHEDIFEMWFASGTLEIGYAISDDGINWEPYCANPIFSGKSSSWDKGKVKAPEVVYAAGSYWMTYSGCGQGCYEVGWAQSSDGTNWAPSRTSWLTRTTPPAWNSYGLQAAFINDSVSPWEIWYTGTGNDSGQIGMISLLSTPN